LAVLENSSTRTAPVIEFGCRTTGWSVSRRRAGQTFEVVEVEGLAFIFAGLIFELSLVKETMDDG